MLRSGAVVVRCDRLGALLLPGLLALVMLLGLASGSPLAAQGAEWSVYAGRWGFDKAGETSELGVEIRRPLESSALDFVGGLAGTADEALWIYAGASLSWEGESRWRVRPGFAVTLFEEGDGRDLGGPVEFRSSLEVSYRTRESLRLGLLVYHLSNAGIYDLNPGSNSLVFVVGFP